KALGVGDELSVRLRRVHSPLDPTAFRLRQLGWSVFGLGVGVVLAGAIATRSPVVAVLVMLGGPVLAYLLVEQNLARASAEQQRRVFLELPVVAEQMGMLLGSGYSLGAVVNRIAERGRGAIAQGLVGVAGRMRQGLSEADALREWADVAAVESLHRLVGVLALNREAGDLGGLISEEARTIRREVHRELLEQIERRSQQVWIPVTVATLVPGAIVLAIPFFDALRQFSSI
ncbi:MAG: type II secretion system F family protein, partial [Acidimicrobiia bacterium]